MGKILIATGTTAIIEDTNKLLLGPGSYTTAVEIVDPHEGTICRLKDYPEPVWIASGGMLQDDNYQIHPVLCGGYNANSTLGHGCFKLSNGDWSQMSLSFGQQTWGMGSAVIGQNLWLLGGRKQHQYSLTAQTMHLNVTGHLVSGPDLAEAVTGACVAVLTGVYFGGKIVAVLGGMDYMTAESGGLKSMQLFSCKSTYNPVDMACQRLSLKGPEMNHPRYGFACGSMITKEGDPILLAMKSHTNTSLEILDLSKPFKDWKWNEGKNLKKIIYLLKFITIH